MRSHDPDALLFSLFGHPQPPTAAELEQPEWEDDQQSQQEQSSQQPAQHSSEEGLSRLDEEYQGEEEYLDDGEWAEGEDSEEAEAAVAALAQPDTAEVLCRIETLCLNLVRMLLDGELPDFTVERRDSSRTAALEEAGVWLEEGEEGSQPRRQGGQLRSLVAPGQPDSADAYARVLMVIGACHELLKTGSRITQRELWYQLKTEEIFRSERDVNTALQEAVYLLQVSRSQLGITCSSKGLVAGNLVIHDMQWGEETDCARANGAGIPITGDVNAIRRYAFQSDAWVILVVEKDAMFQRLIEDGFLEVVPAVLVTGKGMPDQASRVFLHQLAEAFPDKPVLGLVDWNPSGAAILSLYKWGCNRMELLSRNAVPRLQWLGATAAMLDEAGVGAFQELKPRDVSMANNMIRTLQHAEPGWAEELRAMVRANAKAEIEAVHSAVGAAGFCQLLVEHLVRGGHIPAQQPLEEGGES